MVAYDVSEFARQCDQDGFVWKCGSRRGVRSLMIKHGWLRLEGARICDPTNPHGSTGRTLWLHNGRIVEPPTDQREYPSCRLDGCVIMAGGIDLHTHIGGGKSNIARLMLPERDAPQRTEAVARSLSCPVPCTIEAGQRYLEMGYTSCFEPAIIPMGARQAHFEMGDTPGIDTGGYLILGNEEILLRMLSDDAPANTYSANLVRDYVGWMLKAYQCLAVKVVNAGDINSYQWGSRLTDLDCLHPEYRVTPRKILRSLAEAVDRIGLPHPLHVHCARLGRAGNIETTLATIEAVEGRRIHLTHAQFHAYGSEGPHGYSSAAHRLAEVVNANPQVSIDVGQVLFGQTATLSADLPHQFGNRRLASPRKFFFQQIEGQAGCGVLPFRYRQSQYVHSLQWAIGLELFLRINDPWRVFLTTDHPNGAPFVAYPHIVRLLMDYDFRMECFEHLHPEVQKSHPLRELQREYTLEEIAIITRAGPARSLGLSEAGSLRVGAWADLTIYREGSNPQAMFASPYQVYKQGQLVVQDGKQLAPAAKGMFRLRLDQEFRPTAELNREWEAHYQQPMQAAVIRDEELFGYSGATLHEVGLKARG